MAVPAASAARPAAATAPARRARPRVQPPPRRPTSLRGPRHAAATPAGARDDARAARAPCGRPDRRRGLGPGGVRDRPPATRSRLWIGALTTLLVGIVALNVLALELQRVREQDRQAGRRLEARDLDHPRADLARTGASDAAHPGGGLEPRHHRPRSPGSITYLRPEAGRRGRSAPSGSPRAARRPAAPWCAGHAASASSAVAPTP